GVAVAGVLEPTGASHELELAPPLQGAFRLQAAIVERDEIGAGKPDEPDVLFLEEFRRAGSQLVRGPGVERLRGLVAAGSQRNDGADCQDRARQKGDAEADAPWPSREPARPPGSGSTIGRHRIAAWAASR